MTRVEDGSETCIVFLLGYPGVGKRTVGSHLTELLDGVLVDNALIHLPLLTLFKWTRPTPGVRTASGGRYCGRSFRSEVGTGPARRPGHQPRRRQR